MASLPPYRDPELRRAFAMDADEQCALLDRLAGVAPASTTAVPTFTPIPPTVRRTANALVLLPAKFFPCDVLMRADARELPIIIEHSALSRRQQPRRPDNVAELEDALQQHAERIGVLRVPCRPLNTWTPKTIRDVIGTLIEHLPKGRWDLPGNYRASVSDHWRGYVEIEVSARQAPDQWSKPLAEHPFSASVRLHFNVTPAVSDWYGLFDCPKERFNIGAGGSLEQIDLVLSRYGRDAKAKPAALSQLGSGGKFRRSTSAFASASVLKIRALGESG